MKDLWYTMLMKLRFVLVALFLLSLYLGVQFFSSPALVNFPPKNTTIVAFGDSLVEGYGATKGNDFISVLSRKLGRPIKNEGKSGDTTASALQRVEDVLKEDPGIVILLLGGNDYLRRLDESVTRENLSTMIDRFQRSGALVVLLGVRSGVLIDGREKMYEELSEAYGTVYVEDVLKGIFGKPELMFDGIHPNDAGYALIAEKVYEVMADHDLTEVSP